MNGYEHHKLIIIGCGASGMTAAISAAQWCNDICIFERNTIAGRKLNATGNGKCNFTNSASIADRISSTDKAAALDILSRFTWEDSVAFFRRLGLLSTERAGYYYPACKQAAAVSNALVLEMKRLGITCIKLGDSTDRIRREKGLFILNDRYSCDRLIIAAGGSSSPVFGTNGSGVNLAKSLGHTSTPLYPSLTGLKCSDSILNELAGVRADVRISLLVNDKTVYSEAGEMIFNKDNISGIPVMNMSGIAAYHIAQKEKVSVSIDLLPEHASDELSEFVEERLDLNSNTAAPKVFSVNLKDNLNGLLNDKLICGILLLSGAEEKMTNGKKSEGSIASGRTPVNDSSCGKASPDLARRIVSLCKDFRLHVTATNGFENSQVTKGGIRLSEINPDTMESLKCPGLYLCGELLDLDGQCGGFNLQWAWATGVIAGACAGGGSFDKNKFLKT